MCISNGGPRTRCGLFALVPLLRVNYASPSVSWAPEAIDFASLAAILFWDGSWFLMADDFFFFKKLLSERSDTTGGAIATVKQQTCTGCAANDLCTVLCVSDFPRFGCQLSRVCLQSMVVLDCLAECFPKRTKKYEKLVKFW